MKQLFKIKSFVCYNYVYITIQFYKNFVFDAKDSEKWSPCCRYVPGLSAEKSASCHFLAA
jgi:hypothetical protein